MYRADDDAHGREVAVKVLARIDDDSARRRFDRERRAMGTLSGHPNIGVVYTSGFTSSNEPYIVMEMIRGGSLADRLERDGPLPQAEVVELGATLAEALQHAHEGGVLHLDLKPENILMSQFGRPKLVDFGIAALVDDESRSATIRATPAFADPMVLEGKPGTERSDVYGLAATLYTLLDGSPPYSEGPAGLYQVMRRVALAPVPTIERNAVHPTLAQLLQRAMGKEPDDRPASMSDFAHDLRSLDLDSSPRRDPERGRNNGERSDAADDIDPERTVRRGRVVDWSASTPRPRLPDVEAQRSAAPLPPRPQPQAGPTPQPQARPTPQPEAQPRARATPQPQPHVRPTPQPQTQPQRHPQPHAFAGGASQPGGGGGQFGVASAARPEPLVELPKRSGVMRAVVFLSVIALVLGIVLAVLLVQRTRDGSGGVADDAPETTEPTPTQPDPEDDPVGGDGSDNPNPLGPLEVVGAQIRLPEPNGWSTQQVRTGLEEAGLRVTEPPHCFDAVDGLSPEVGTLVDPGTEVELKYPPCIVPDFVGLSLDEAIAVVEEEFVVGLTISWEAFCEDGVIGQSVPAGTPVDPNTDVEIELRSDC